MYRYTSLKRFVTLAGLLIAAVCPFLHIRSTAAEPPMLGVNLAGGEFGTNPGTYGTNYIYPNEAEFDYYRERGLTLIRLPFKWERVQHSLNVALDATETARIDAVIGYARERDMKVILDMHNYNKYKLSGTTYLVGSTQVPHSAFEDVWTRIADRYKDEPAVFGYDLMNEPQGTLSNWQAAAQDAVDGIRTKDTRHWVIVEGVGWAGTQSWASINDTLSVDDPVDKLMYSAHSYWDSNHDGVYGSYTGEGGYADMGVDYARPFIDWLNENNYKGFIGEYGVPHGTNADEWKVALDNFLAYCRDNGVSGTYWAGGPWWGDYALTCEPSPLSDPDRPQMEILSSYGQLLYETEHVASSSASKTVSTLNEAALSGGAGEYLSATAVNDYITYTLPDVPAGEYRVIIGVKRHSHRGNFQLDIDGVDQGPGQSLYLDYGASYEALNLGVKTFGSTGNKTFTFTVTGKHADSISYALAIDYICLSRGGGEPPVIVDNGDGVGVTWTGTWSGSTSAPGYYSTSYRHDQSAGKGSKSARFTPTLAAAGNYEVFARWAAGANRASNVPIIVNDTTGTQPAVTVNQQQDGGVWNSLGTYFFNAGTGGNVLIGTAGTSGYVIADAVKFQPVSSDIIIDNTHPTAVARTGTWISSTSAAGYYGSDYLHDNNGGKGAKSVRFTPDLPVAGSYEVFARWSANANRASNVPIDVLHAGGSDTETVDQQTQGGQWVSLGTYTFNAGTSGYVLIRTTGTSGYVIADAVKFVAVSP